MTNFVGSKASLEANDWLTNEITSLGLSICGGVFVDNQSKYKLEFLTSNFNTGYPHYDVKKSFKTDDECNYYLPPGSTGVQLWRNHHGGNTGKYQLDYCYNQTQMILLNVIFTTINVFQESG